MIDLNEEYDPFPDTSKGIWLDWLRQVQATDVPGNPVITQFRLIRDGVGSKYRTTQLPLALAGIQIRAEDIIRIADEQDASNFTEIEG